MSDSEREPISADLPYELQSKMFDQLAGVGIAGAGLTVTLVSSVLEHAPGIKWLAVAEFALAALAAMAGNIRLIDALFKGEDARTQSRLMTGITALLIGMGIGSLTMSVYLDGKSHPSARPAQAK